MRAGTARKARHEFPRGPAARKLAHTPAAGTGHGGQGGPDKKASRPAGGVRGGAGAPVWRPRPGSNRTRPAVCRGRGHKPALRNCCWGPPLFRSPDWLGPARPSWTRSFRHRPARHIGAGPGASWRGEPHVQRYSGQKFSFRQPTTAAFSQRAGLVPGKACIVSHQAARCGGVARVLRMPTAWAGGPGRPSDCEGGRTGPAPISNFSVERWATRRCRQTGLQVGAGGGSGMVPGAGSTGRATGVCNRRRRHSVTHDGLSRRRILGSGQVLG